MASYFVMIALLAIMFPIVLADDASLQDLQDFCVAEMTSSVRVNGLTCKDSKLVEADDFYFSGLNIAGNTSNVFGSQGTPVFVTQLPGLNSLGVSMGRIDLAPWGVNPPHINPRATEIFTVIEGYIEVAFITSNPENRLITKVLKKGDVWVFPRGLIHYQRNVGSYSATALVAYNSQSPGVVGVASAVFGSYPKIPSDLLAKAFQVDEKVIDELQTKF